jgi:hypothetical protein
VLYVWSGAVDSGGAPNTGTASAIHCSTFSNVPENIQIIVKNSVGLVVANVTNTLQPASTVTWSTHFTVAYTDIVLGTGTVAQGSMAVLATSINVFCTAQVLDASAAVPIGMSLHGIRFNPIPGTSE